ncbi:MAG TPA: GGDEF domain-containing protein [Burkholderiales bacterium]
MLDRLRALRPLWVPGGILAAAALLVWWGKTLPSSYAGLRIAGPYTLLAVAVGLAWWFNRGRSFVIALSILAGFAAYQAFPQKAVYTALTVLVPINAAAVLIRADRGARYRAAYDWLLLLAIEALLVLWIGAAGKSRFSGTAWLALLDQWWLRSPPTPFVGRIAFAAAFAAAVWRAWPDFKPVPVGNAGAIAALFIACEWVRSPDVYALFMAAGGLILVAALVEESHQLAFRDQLTGLPGRRALEERLRSLDGGYAIGMVDVDHFKKFNDTHGHDVGDQVLKLVAGRLAQVGAGGTAYRYGGEEFSVLFPHAGIGEAERALDAVRVSIEKYPMAVRGPDRPKKGEEGIRRRGEFVPEKTLSVTVSIGVAAPSQSAATPQQVIKAADAALYRAKQAGRNRVSR